MRDKRVESMQHGEPALSRFTDSGGYEEQDPIERLRFFCSLAMNGQDWLDVEPFFAAIRKNTMENLQGKQGEPVAWLHKDCATTEHGYTSDERAMAVGFKPLYTSAPTIPEGWQLVPIEPTEHQCFQGVYATEKPIIKEDALAIYRAMLSATTKGQP